MPQPPFLERLPTAGKSLFPGISRTNEEKKIKRRERLNESMLYPNSVNSKKRNHDSLSETSFEIMKCELFFFLPSLSFQTHNFSPNVCL